MIKQIGRFAIRHEPTKPDGPFLVIGSVNAKSTLLKHGHVYELREILGEIVLHDCGECCINGHLSESNENRPYQTWGHTIDDLIVGGSPFLLTLDEWRLLND